MNEKNNDPEIPFRVSHATLIAQTVAKVSMLTWMMGGVLTLEVALFGWLLIRA